MIRRAGLADVPLIVEMGAAFHAYSPWRDVSFDPNATAAFVAGLVERGVVFLSEAGMIGGILSPSFFNPAHLVAVELFWWASGGGGALREAFEAWAREQGAHGVQFSALGDQNSERMAGMFARAGYRPVETGYFKGL